MARQQVVETVNRILTDEFELEPERVTPDAHIIDDLELDSLDAVDLIAALEDAFGGRVDENQARQVRTVSDVYQLIEGAIEAAAQRAAQKAGEAADAPSAANDVTSGPSPALEAGE